LKGRGFEPRLKVSQYQPQLQPLRTPYEGRLPKIARNAKSYGNVP